VPEIARDYCYRARRGNLTFSKDHNHLVAVYTTLKGHSFLAKTPEAGAFRGLPSVLAFFWGVLVFLAWTARSVKD
jgi:hypothetical protein